MAASQTIEFKPVSRFDSLQAERSEESLIDQYIREQKTLTPVDRFSRKHEEQLFPAQQKYYQDLIPLGLPAAGQQYAFEVNLDQCTGCKGCVTACHSLNGLDEGETWRSVGLLHGGSTQQPVQQTVTTACHHCVDPACMNGCPVLAYEKDPVTGIVRHLDDQCIGCQYCILKCPYDVPKYHKTKGIVRKCDMCSSRLTVGEAPACVQACPNEAIKITLVDRQEVSTGFRERGEEFLVGAPEGSYTLPTTRYVTNRPLPSNMRPADDHEIKPEHAHPPLVMMLVLSQLSVGAFLFGWLTSFFPFPSHDRAFQAISALAAGLLALASSTLHLGRPLYAWRAVLGLKTSWLSREIVAFGLFAKFAILYAASFWLEPFLAILKPGIVRDSLTFFSPATIQNGLGFMVIFSGFAGIYCSARIYQDTRREFWKAWLTTGRFFGTTLLLGLATIPLALGLSLRSMPAADAANLSRIVQWFLFFLLTISLTKLGWEAMILSHLKSGKLTPLKRTALLMKIELRNVTAFRFLSGFCGGLLLPALLILLGPTSIPPVMLSTLLVLSLVFCLIGELLERHLFFSCVIPPKMPGSLSL